MFMCIEFDNYHLGILLVANSTPIDYLHQSQPVVNQLEP